MNKEESIDDILKLLKDSVAEDQAETVAVKEKKQRDLSTDALQKKLKNQYLYDTPINVNDLSDVAVESEYVIDSDFLNEVNEINKNSFANIDDIIAVQEPVDDSEFYEDESEITELNLESGNLPDEEPEGLIELDEIVSVENEATPFELAEDSSDAEPEETEEISADENEDTESVIQYALEDDSQIAADIEQDADDESDLPPDNIDELIAALRPIENDESESADEEIEDIHIIERPDEYLDGSLDDQRYFHLDEQIVKQINEQLDEQDEADAEPVPEIEQPHETFLASMRKTGLEFTTGELYNSLIDERKTCDDEESDSLSSEADALLEDAMEDIINPSTVNLMMQFCDKEEVDSTLGDENVDDFLKCENSTVSDETNTNVFGNKEYVDESQQHDIYHAYKHKLTNALLAFLGCAAFSVIAVIFELLPMLEVRLNGALDYQIYPAVYALVGLQFVAFSVAIRHKQLWWGLKRAFSLTPNVHSVVALTVVLTAVYDLITVTVLAVTGDELPHMYNGLTVFLVAVCALMDYLEILAERKAFDVYSNDSKKYTLLKESANTAVGMKMYSGGVPKNKNIYSVAGVDVPNGFFRSISSSQNNGRFISVMLIPVFLVGAIASVVSMIMGADAYQSCSAILLALYLFIPTTIIMLDKLPYAIALFKLSKKGGAFAGKEAAENFADGDIVVFNDSYVFKKCKTDDIGIAIYDSKAGYLALGCLRALYSRIGGPLSDLQFDIPEVFNFKDVSVRRISRNGIEAVIEKKHVIIVGEAAFMQRYGLSFPPDEKQLSRSTLCVSLDGKITAKLSIKYQIEPAFEMLVERLGKEGIDCAIQTYDPLINSELISSSRTVGSTSVSVIHNSVTDFNADIKSRYRTEADGVISCASRLMLAEIQVWLKRLSKINGILKNLTISLSVLGGLAFLTMLLGGIPVAEQVYIFALFAVEIVAVIFIALAILPGKRYFTVDSLYKDLEKEYLKQKSKDN